MLEEALQMDSEDPSLYYQLAEIHVSLGEYETAVELIRTAYLRIPEEVDFLFYIGDLYRSQDQFESAVAAYREGLSHKPNAEVLYKVADVLYRDKKEYVAMEYLQKAVVEDPQFTDAVIFLGNRRAAVFSMKPTGLAKHVSPVPRPASHSGRLPPHVRRRCTPMRRFGLP
jgi:tetratricopeptide (TPR) repeat protein